MLTTGPARIDQPRMIFRPPGQRLALVRVTGLMVMRNTPQSLDPIMILTRLLALQVLH